MKKVVNGTSYSELTNDSVIDILERARQNKTRIRVFYGDIQTGKDWCEENDVLFYVGRSSGQEKIPLAMLKINSIGGGAIFDDCIVKIQNGKNILYQHDNYHQDTITIKETDGTLKEKGYTTSVYIGNTRNANFKSRNQAERYVKFITGEWNKK